MTTTVLYIRLECHANSGTHDELLGHGVRAGQGVVDCDEMIGGESAMSGGEERERGKGPGISGGRGYRN